MEFRLPFLSILFSLFFHHFGILVDVAISGLGPDGTDTYLLKPFLLDFQLLVLVQGVKLLFFSQRREKAPVIVLVVGLKRRGEDTK